jgi:hypothetical protein
VLAGRIQIILDNILWVATLAQVRSAIHFYRHVMDIIKASTSTTSKASKAVTNMSKEVHDLN